VNVPVPRLVAWELTRACNLKCRHCRAKAGGAVGRNERELSFEEAKRVVDDIASFAQPILILTGGEPLLCPHLFGLVAYAREKGLKPVIGTNATLIDEATATRIAASGVTRISVSIDFPTAAAHDAFRGVSGSFDAAVAGIRAMRRAGVEVQVNTTVTRLNRHLLEDIHALAVSLDVQALHPFLLVPTGRGADLSGEELSAAEYEETLSWVSERQKTSPLEFKPTDAPQYQRIVRQQGGCGLRGKGCLAGTGFAFIGHAGDVQPCGYFDLKLGNVRERPFSRIWAESPVLDDLRHPERLKGKCGACGFKAVCGGCRARALAKSGDYLAEEPFCAHVPEQELVDLLQTDFPLVERPYAELGKGLGISEDACYQKALALREAGIVRRIGASFVPRRLGYVPLLAAAKVSAGRLDEVAASVSAYPQVTHNYAREGAFNLWFTVIARTVQEAREILMSIAALPGVEELLELPSEKTYKLRAVFPSRGGDAPVASKVMKDLPSNAERTPRQRIDPAFVRAMQGDILDRGLMPFSPDELAHVRELVADGTIRRFGAFVQHRTVGYVANALAVWQVSFDRLDAAGTALAASPSVSHCYVRTPQDGWPHNLYAMVHARTSAELEATCEVLSKAVGTAVGATAPMLVMKTVREYKKSSARYFAETPSKLCYNS